MVISTEGAVLTPSFDSEIAKISNWKILDSSSSRRVLSSSMWRVIEWMFKWKIENDLFELNAAFLNSS